MLDEARLDVIQARAKRVKSMGNKLGKTPTLRGARFEFFCELCYLKI